MGTNFSFISELQTIRKQKSNLSERERELTTPILTDFSLIPEIYSQFKAILGNMEPEPFAESPTQRKKFIFIILCLYAPSALAGGKMPSGLREGLAKTLNINSRTVISDNCSDVVFWYNNYESFKNDVDYLYNKISLKIIEDGLM